jgi:hypothetical protein
MPGVHALPAEARQAQQHRPPRQNCTIAFTIMCAMLASTLPGAQELLADATLLHHRVAPVALPLQCRPTCLPGPTRNMVLQVQAGSTQFAEN